MKIAAVVVTYNRKDLLTECLRALLNQTRALDEIIVIDNASTDGTAETISSEFSEITYVRLSANIGGAGGFHEGMKLAYEKGSDWIWVMDDDAIPDVNALNSLLMAFDSVNHEIGLLCSHVEWIDGSPHIMNIPQVSVFIHGANGSECPFNQYIDKGLVRIYGCSFVSTLISRHAIEMVGLPIKEMFIYADDVEFTQRICRRFPGYYVIRSRVIHKTHRNSGVDISKDPSQQLWRHFFDIRNITYIYRQNGLMFLAKYCLVDWPRILRKALNRRENRLRAFAICIRGLIAGLFFRPKIVKL